jgi:hypothetical protein
MAKWNRWKSGSRFESYREALVAARASAREMGDGLTP